MVDSFCKDGNDSGINLVCDKRCVVLTRGNWERDLRDYKDCMSYNKSKLNDTYLHDKNRDAIMKQARESAGGNLL